MTVRARVRRCGAQRRKDAGSSASPHGFPFVAGAKGIRREFGAGPESSLLPRELRGPSGHVGRPCGSVRSRLHRVLNHEQREVSQIQLGACPRNPATDKAAEGSPQRPGGRQGRPGARPETRRPTRRLGARPETRRPRRRRGPFFRHPAADHTTAGRPHHVVGPPRGVVLTVRPSRRTGPLSYAVGAGSGQRKSVRNGSA